MTEEFCLSDKIEKVDNTIYYKGLEVVEKIDVKEFIRRLKEEVNENLEFNRKSWTNTNDAEIAVQRFAIAKLHTDLLDVIDKLVGEKLI